MRHVTDAYAGMIMTGQLNRDTLVTSLADSCSMSWPAFLDCAKTKLRECNLDENLAAKVHQSSMCLNNKPRDLILDLVSQLPEEVDVSCVTQSKGGSFQPCVAQLFGIKRPENLFLETSRSILAKRYVQFIQCAVDMVAESTCPNKEVMATVFTVFGLTTTPTGVLVTKDDLEASGLLSDGDRNDVIPSTRPPAKER
ncbi:uncharacterized protein LOC135481664 [Liolophura sinensis]|uniref:uncharacterized protein LOC135481664 n=1 Tax=Liolophura sinensis TaxID=3198878 RepID=UPI00315826EE